MRKVSVALIQTRSGRSVPANVDWVSAEVETAARAGASFIATPEMTTLLERDRAELFRKVGSEADDEARDAFARLAGRLKVWLLVGSMPVQLASGQCANRSQLFAPDGRLVATYDKIHMFDVEIDAANVYRESATYAAGHRAVIAETDWANIGLTICYDVRFPALYRALAEAGAEIITVPAAFTKPTGEAHWHTLLRARAIETGAFILAPAQGGVHEDGRITYGHSLVIDPWGTIIAERDSDAPGILFAELDLDAVAEARRKIPSLRHAQTWTLDRRS